MQIPTGIPVETAAINGGVNAALLCAQIPAVEDKELSENGRIAARYVYLGGNAERIGFNLYRNLPGEYDIRMFEAAVKYF